MSKQLSRPGLEKRIRRALERLQEGDAEDAVFNISPALDATARKRYPNKGVSDRIKSFVFDEQPLIYYLSMQGKYLIPDGVRIVMVEDDAVGRPSGGHGGELSDFVYYCVRCAQQHEAEIDYEQIDFGRNFGIGRERFDGDGGDLEAGKFIISIATVFALVLAVICASENRRLRLPGDINLYGKVTLSQKELVGNKVYLMGKLNELFAGDS